MAAPASQFYFTLQDPDYIVKGSRDPLGFQVLWQHQARQLIPYLSTVSINLRDFQVLCLAYYLYGGERDAYFARYMLRLEQLMAYARYTMGDQRFNGIDKVRLRLNEEPKTLSISNSNSDEILSNQRAYGIWGKYSRPFRDIRFLQHPRFDSIFSAKINHLNNGGAALKLLNRVLEKESCRVAVEELSQLHPLLKYNKEELSLYRELILHVHTPRPFQNELYGFLEADGIPEDFSLYAFLQAFKRSSFGSDPLLQDILTEIEETEKLLCPLNRIFRYLQTRPLWPKEDIQGDAYFQQCRQSRSYVFPAASEENKTKNGLSLSLTKDNWTLVEDLVKRNSEVAGWRGGAPWLTLNGNVLEVHHREGGFYHPDYDPALHCDNYYFIDTYIQLYHQIKHR